jgi:phosphatidate cytidylyltransferase
MIYDQDFRQRIKTILWVAPFLVAGIWFSKTQVPVLLIIMGLCFIEWISCIYRHEKKHKIALGFMGVIFISCAFAFFIQNRSNPSVWAILISIWATDSGAYIVGRALGGPKICPSISPKKTWSGAIGGFFFGFFAFGAVIYCADISHVFPLAGGWAPWSLVVPFMTQVGDLSQSLLKRKWKIKDMGALLPGHGGVLDRLDSLLMVGCLFFLVQCIQKYFFKG